MRITIDEINAVHRNAEQKKMLLEQLGIEDEIVEEANIEIAQAATSKGVSRKTAKIARMIMAEARRLNIEPAKIRFSSLGISDGL